MKKVFVVLAAAALLFCSCSGDKCKCTTKTVDAFGNKTETTATVSKPEDKTCADVAKAGTHDLGELGSTSMSCKTVSE